MQTKFLLECPSCDFKTKRTKAFDKHIKAEHGAESTESFFVEMKLSGSVPACACGCGEKTKFSGWRLGFSDWVAGHNGRLSALDDEEADRIKKKRSESLTGRQGWSRGKTKETDEALARAAKSRSKTVKIQFQTGERRVWSKGLTKETDERLAKHAATLKSLFEDGKIAPWTKGKTKETDEQVYNMSCSVASSMRKTQVRERLDGLKRLSNDEIYRRISENCQNIALVSGVDSYSRDKHENLVFECKHCGLQQKKSLLQAMSDRCISCHPKGSSQQIAIYEIIKSWDLHAISCDRNLINPYEIDVLIPSKKLCIEFNGLYFHSELWKGKSYHSDKTAMCAKVQHQLFHIFEDEWREKKEIVLSMLRHKLGISSISLDARKCEIRKLTPSERKHFFDSSHIDGDTGSLVAWGLIDKEHGIVAALSARNPMHKTYTEKKFFEIARFATKCDCSVRGALSRLMSVCEREAKNLGYAGMMTYVDTRHGTGTSYAACGYMLVDKSPNRFWWTDGKNRINRFKVRADKEAKKTEKEIAAIHGVIKIWGTPNLRFEKKFN